MDANTDSAQQILEVALAEHPLRSSIVAALTSKVHLVVSEVQLVRLWAITHRQRWVDLTNAGYGLRGGSAADRRLVAEGLALLEEAGTFEQWLTLTCSAHQIREAV